MKSHASHFSQGLPGLLLHPSPHPPGSPHGPAPGGPSVRSGLSGWRPASSRGQAHAGRAATPVPQHASHQWRRSHRGPPEGQVGTRAAAEPLTWAGAEPLTWAGAGPPEAGAGPHLSCSNPRPTRPGSRAAADAEPAVALEPEPRPPPPSRRHFRDCSRPRGGPRVSVVPPRLVFGRAASGLRAPGQGSGESLLSDAVALGCPPNESGWEENGAGQSLAGVQGRKLRPGGAGRLHLPWGWAQPGAARRVGSSREGEGDPRVEPITSHRPGSPGDSSSLPGSACPPSPHRDGNEKKGPRRTLADGCECWLHPLWTQYI